jgi:hypothetical protein
MGKISHYMKRVVYWVISLMDTKNSQQHLLRDIIMYSVIQ